MTGEMDRWLDESMKEEKDERNEGENGGIKRRKGTRLTDRWMMGGRQNVWPSIGGKGVKEYGERRKI